MTPLDVGYVSPSLCLVDPFGDRVGPSPENFEHLGFYLRAVREHRGWTLSDLATVTRIRRLYLAAIEDGDLSSLPSRPFALGYVRSYAKALGLDGELAIARFKQEYPFDHEPLRAPAGVRHQTPQRHPLIMAAVGILVFAVLVWNLFQRANGALTAPGPANLRSTAAMTGELPPPPRVNGAFVVAAPSPAPSESSTPKPYVTPGLEAVIGPMTAAETAETRGADELPLGVPFEARGQVYGVASVSGDVLLQARKSALLVLRRPDNQVFFARLLKVGETARAPVGHGLTAEVNDPDGFYVFQNNSLVGRLTAPRTVLDKIEPPPPSPAEAESSQELPAH